MTHFISLKTAKEMTALYRMERENILAESKKGQDILPICESFDKADFTAMIEQDGCIGVRIYYGMTADKKVHAIIVGFDADDKDILPTITDETEIDNSNIIEEGTRCPMMCPLIHH